MLHFRHGKMSAFIRVAKYSVILQYAARAREVKEPVVPCGVSFPSFFPLMERNWAVGDNPRAPFGASGKLTTPPALCATSPYTGEARGCGTIGTSPA